MVREQLFNYEFDTDDVLPKYVLKLHVRNIRNKYLTSVFIRSLKTANKLSSVGDAKSFVSSVDNFVVPDRFFKIIKTNTWLFFKMVRDRLCSKHDISFLTWDVCEAFFYRNPQDSSEWILGVVYSGDYDD